MCVGVLLKGALVQRGKRTDSYSSVLTAHCLLPNMNHCECLFVWEARWVAGCGVLTQNIDLDIYIFFAMGIEQFRRST